MSGNRTRFGKAIMIMTELYTKILREMAEKRKHAADLHREILSGRYGFMSSLSGREMDQVRSLEYNGYTLIDISFMYKLIKAFQLVERPTKGWTDPPDINDINPGDDVQRIKNTRNELAHSPDYTMTESKWSAFFDEVIKISKRCDRYLNKSRQESYELEARRLETTWLDESERRRYETALERLAALQSEVRVEGHLVQMYTTESVSGHIQQMSRQLVDDSRDLVYINVFIYVPVTDEDRVRLFLLSLPQRSYSAEWYQMTPIWGMYGSIFLNVRAKEENFKSKEILHERLTNMLSRILPDLKGSIGNQLKVVVGIDTSKDDLIKDSKKWRNIRNKTIPKLKSIENKLTEAGNRVNTFRIGRYVGVGLGFLGLVFAPLTAGVSLGWTASAMALVKTEYILVEEIKREAGIELHH